MRFRLSVAVRLLRVTRWLVPPACGPHELGVELTRLEIRLRSMLLDLVLPPSPKSTSRGSEARAGRTPPRFGRRKRSRGRS